MIPKFKVGDICIIIKASNLTNIGKQITIVEVLGTLKVHKRHYVFSKPEEWFIPRVDEPYYIVKGDGLVDGAGKVGIVMACNESKLMKISPDSDFYENQSDEELTLPSNAKSNANLNMAATGA
jgi:hypothetical protein